MSAIGHLSDFYDFPCLGYNWLFGCCMYDHFFYKKKMFSVKDSCVVHILLIKIIDYMDIFIIVWQVNLLMSIMRMWPFCSDHGPLQ